MPLVPMKHVLRSVHGCRFYAAFILADVDLQDIDAVANIKWATQVAQAWFSQLSIKTI